MKTSSQKYISPNKRGVTPIKKQSNETTLIEINDNKSFPSLKESLTANYNTSHMSFASIAKKVDQQVKVEKKVSDVKPGWVHIRRNKNTGSIEFKNNPTNKNTYTIEDEIYEEKRLSKYLFTRRVTLQQWVRDIENEMLGDLSPFWNTKTILEMHEDKDFQEGDYDDDYNNYNNNSENSDYSDNN